LLNSVRNIAKSGNSLGAAPATFLRNLAGHNFLLLDCANTADVRP